MAKKMLSILGTGRYQRCTYEGENLNSVYIQSFIAKKYTEGWTNEDQVIVFLTDDARTRNWLDQSTQTGLSKDISNHTNARIRDVSIEDGRTKAEIWSIFDTIYNEIDEGDEIIFDITHGLRYIPMLALLVLSYAKVLKNIKINGIYYGAHEFRSPLNNYKNASDGSHERNSDPDEVIPDAPILEIKEFSEILDWTNAVHSFVSHGNSKHIKDISKYSVTEGCRLQDSESIQIRKFADSLDNFTNCIYTCRGAERKNFKKQDKSAAVACDILKKNLKDIIDSRNDAVKPLKPLFEKIDETLESFDHSDNLTTGMSITEWSIDKGLTQQAYTSLRENLTTYICLKFNLDETDINKGRKYAEGGFGIRLNIEREKGNRRKEGFKIDYIREEKNKEDKEYVENVKRIVEELDDELVSIYQKVRQPRNDINHFGYGKNSVLSFKDLNDKIKESYNDFKSYIERNPLNMV